MQSSSYVERMNKKCRFDDHDPFFKKHHHKKNKKKNVSHKRAFFEDNKFK
jgi:hypothetical protein